MYLNEQYKIVPVVPPADYSTTAIQGAGIDISKAHHVTICMILGAQTNGDAQVLLEYGTAHQTMVGHVPNLYAWRTNTDIGAVGGDILTNAVARASGEDYFLIPINDKRMIVIEVPVDEIPAGNAWIRLTVGNQGAATFVSVVAIVQPRFKPLATAVRT